MNNLLENLNPEQLKAVLHKDGPLLIIAGAGTGKTTVITQRIAYIIEQGIAKADEILALTFTEKAAGEMADRVDDLLPIGYLDLWISTFHSFGERLLAEHGLEIGLPAGAKLLNEFEQWALIKKNLDKFDLDYYRPLGNPTKFIHALIKHFARLKDEDISPADYLKYADGLKENLDAMLGGGSDLSLRGDPSRLTGTGRRGNPVKKRLTKELRDRKAPPQFAGELAMTASLDEHIAGQETARINEVANAYHIYQQLLLDNNAMDFGDLINYCLKLFRSRPAVLNKYREQFKFILLDEFQDTNWSQYELIKLLAAPKNNLVVVGDDDQSVYRFRGASMSNILQFKKDYPDSQEIVLTKNYRNAQNILDLSYNFIQLNNPNRLEWQLNEENRRQTADCRRQKKEPNKSVETRYSASLVTPKDQNILSKKLIAKDGQKGEIEVIQGADLQTEVNKVVEKIAELKIRSKRGSTEAAHSNENDEVSWSDFAILVRANDSAKEFCNALDLAGLPYQFLASRGLYAKPVIMDIVAYLKLLDNYHESTSLYRLLNLPVFDFTYQELVNFNFIAHKKAWSLFGVLENMRGKMGVDLQSKIDKVLSLVARHTAMVRDKNASEIIFAFLNDSGYLKYLTGGDEAKSRENISYLNQFMKRVTNFENASDDKSVKAFLAELNLEIESGEEGGLSPDMESGPEAIKIMTIHAAKGLEFKYVFIANMVDKRFPTIERKEAIAIPDALVKEILPEGDVHLEEERRLFYVAMTRAKQGLYFSWAPDYGGTRRKKPSLFLFETGLLNDENKKCKGKSKNDKEFMIYDLGFKNLNKNIPKSEILNPKFKIPNYFSYTQLAAFSNCPYQYRFAHILKIPCRGKFNFSFGKTMHSTMQKIFALASEKSGLGQSDLFGQNQNGKIKKPYLTLEEIIALYRDSWIDEWYESPEQKKQYKKLGQEILKSFYEKYKDKWPQPVFLEKGFNYKIKIGNNYFTIKGMIDRIDEIAGGLKIIDYKTGKPKEKLEFQEKEQLLIYQLAAAELFRQPVKSVAFYYLENNSELEFIGNENDLAKINEKISENINNIQKGEFPPKPSMLCRFCDFFDICEYRQS